MGAKVWLWRWRRNPLRRRSDVAEAWVGLVASAVALVCAPLAGVAAAGGTEEQLLRQGQDRHRTAAAVLRDVPAGPASESAGSEGLARGAVRWTGPDGKARTGETQVPAGSRAGTPVTVWLDDGGRLTREPPTAAEARVQAGLAGASAAGGVCALLLGGRHLVGWRLDRRRADAWEREWAEIGPRWGHRRA